MRIASARAGATEGALARRAKALARLAQSDAVLAPLRDRAGHGVLARGDRRRRPAAVLRPEDVHALAAEGAICPSGIAQCWLLSGPGRARVRRDAAEAHPFLEQHAPVVPRPVIEADGEIRYARGTDPGGPVARLLRLTADGAGFFSGREIAAARQIWSDFEGGQRGLLRGSDLEAAPKSGAARGPGSGQEAAMLAGLAARDSVREALEALPRPFAAAVRAFCLDETGLEALERQSRWPARSGKVVLKLALELLADHYRLA